MKRRRIAAADHISPAWTCQKTSKALKDCTRQLQMARVLQAYTKLPSSLPVLNNKLIINTVTVPTKTKLLLILIHVSRKSLRVTLHASRESIFEHSIFAHSNYGQSLWTFVHQVFMINSGSIKSSTDLPRLALAGSFTAKGKLLPILQFCWWAAKLNNPTVC